MSCIYSQAANIEHIPQHHVGLSREDSSYPRESLLGSADTISNDNLAKTCSNDAPFSGTADLPPDFLCAYMPELNWLSYLDENSSNWEDPFNLATYTTVQPYSNVQDNAPNFPSFHFLTNFTSQTGLLNSFECGTQTLREQVMYAFVKSEDENRLLQTVPSPSMANLSNPMNGKEGLQSYMSNPRSSSIHHPLDPVTHEIVHRIKEVVLTKPKNSVVSLEWSVSLERECVEFFAPPNIRKFLGLYWAVWHPNINFLHRPTFDAVEVECALLASMVLIGKLTRSLQAS
jgi:hypothetical protein